MRLSKQKHSMRLCVTQRNSWCGCVRLQAKHSMRCMWLPKQNTRCGYMWLPKQNTNSRWRCILLKQTLGATLKVKHFMRLYASLTTKHLMQLTIWQLNTDKYTKHLKEFFNRDDKPDQLISRFELDYLSTIFKKENGWSRCLLYHAGYLYNPNNRTYHDRSTPTNFVFLEENTHDAVVYVSSSKTLDVVVCDS